MTAVGTPAELARNPASLTGRYLSGELEIPRPARRRSIQSDRQIVVQGARDAQDPIAYSRCAAAQYALIRGFGFARHVRTNVTEQGGLWRADAVYTVSPALPRGFRTIDAEVTVADCTEQGIPTV